MSFYHDELSWSWDSAARETAQNIRDDRDMQDWEPELERARRRSPIDEPCCLNPSNFTAHTSFNRDPETGHLEGTYYQCGNCGSRICEEDYASLIDYTERAAALAQEILEHPIPDEPGTSSPHHHHHRRKVA